MSKNEAAPIFSSHGLALVPLAPTEAMINAAYQRRESQGPQLSSQTIYKIMLASRPPHCSEVEKAVEALIAAAKDVDRTVTATGEQHYWLEPLGKLMTSVRALEAKLEGK